MARSASLLLCFLILASWLSVLRAANSFLQPALLPSDPAKKDYALIYGTVWSADHHPVGGVPIKIRRASDKKPKWELISDSRGEFAQRVPVGAQDYIIQADVKTPKGQPKPETTVHIDDNERQDISIQLTTDAVPRK